MARAIRTYWVFGLVACLALAVSGCRDTPHSERVSAATVTPTAEAKAPVTPAQPSPKPETRPDDEVPASEVPTGDDLLLQRDYLYEVTERRLALTTAQEAWLAYGTDGWGAGLSKAEEKQISQEHKGLFWPNYAQVDSIIEKTRHPSIVGVKLKSGQDLTDWSGHTAKSSDTKTLYVFRGQLIRKGRFKTSQERLAFEAAQADANPQMIY